ncbi:MAG TPA: DegT/DnrJ/EryC1/StrS family aminotransferase [Candidatus Portnoybacteria bacterium]|nr:DegT/DnrJ/EryC1/StrS family aminotransferase [Candidatus Portnoybacteria bacterium]
MTQKNNQKYIRVCEPYITQKEIDAVSRAIKEGNISSTAKYVGLFEKAFAKKFGVKYAVAVNSGGSALFLALWALGIKKGDEIIVPTFTMVATANAVVQCGAKPVFVDCEENGNIDVKKIEEKITKKTKAIIPVHIYGHPCDMDEIMAIAKKHKLFVIEDTAEAHGALYKNKLAGTFGDMGCFSFYANKVMTTGEGGMIITNNAALYKKLIKLKAYYFHDKRHFWHEQQAWNLRMSALEASLGLAQLERLNELVSLRRENARYYTDKLQGLKDYLVFPSEKKGAKSVFWMYGLVLKKGNRDKLMKFLEKNGVETRTYFFPMNWQPIYKETEPYPVADRLGRNGLYLPSSSHLTKAEKDRIIGLVKKFFKA